MENQTIKTEDAIKFFAGLSTAGIGFLIALVARFPEVLNRAHHPRTFIFMSLGLFGISLALAGWFYFKGCAWSSKKQLTQWRMVRLAHWCMVFCLLGVYALVLMTAYWITSQVK
jgi:hypothetical protein